jgi:DNA-binding HxlR family transcriptional regulator
MEALGDRWSLVVIREIMFGNRRHFRDLLTHSEERIASNILAAGARADQQTGRPSHSQKAIYSLTEPAIQLVPVFATIGSWGAAALTCQQGTQHSGTTSRGGRCADVERLHERFEGEPYQGSYRRRERHALVVGARAANGSL